MEVSATISESTRDSLVDYTSNLVNRYAELSTLLDGGREVNQKSVEKFGKLFLPNAQVQADFYEQPPERYYTVSEYTSDVYRRLRYDGIKVRVENAEISEIRFDVDGFYTIELKLTRLIYNPLDNSGMVKSIASGKRFTQIMTVSVQEGDIENPKIYRIQGNSVPRRTPDYVRFMGVTAAGGVRKFDVKTSLLWDNTHSASGFLVTSGPVVSGGFEFATNRLPFSTSGSGKVFLNFGFFWEQMTITSRISDFSIDYFPATAFDPVNNPFQYSRKVSNLQATEDISLASVVVPLGLSFRVVGKPRSSLLLSFLLKPGIVIKTSGSMTGTGNYSAYVNASNWDTDKKNAINMLVINDPTAYLPLIIGERELSGIPAPVLQSVSLTTSFSPRYYRRLGSRNPSASLMFGVDLSLGISSPVSHSSSQTDLFTYPDKYEGSVLTHYTEDMTTLGISFIIGIHQQLLSSK